MNNNDEGFSTPVALTAVFSLGILSLSLCMITAAGEKYISSCAAAVSERKKIDSIIYRTEERIQALKELPSDSGGNEILSLTDSACTCDFKVTDVSTGINRNFASEKFLKDRTIDEYVTTGGGDVFVSYGWINPEFSDRTVLENAAKDFEGKDMFPLVNSLPPLNVHYMSESFIKAVLEFCGIKEAQKKAELVKDRISSDTTVKELSEILGVAESHGVFDLIGTKTAFWQVDIETEKVKGIAVFAAVPQKENMRKIEKYILAEKKIYLKGGNHDGRNGT
ncbi:MAG: hypothetical protein ACI4LX_05100 [Treponema sp.]